jgi:glycine oxidase
MQKQYDVLIIGAGVAGMLSAFLLKQQQPTCRVALLDQQAPGRESSWAGGGILSPLYPWQQPAAISTMVRYSQLLYPTFLEKLKRYAGIDPEWEASGMLILDAAEQAAALAWAQQEAYPLECWSAARLQAFWPLLSAEFREALWLPGVAQVRNPRLLKALYYALQRLQVPVFADVEVTAWQDIGHGIALETANAKPWQAKQIVITTGAWSQKLLPELSVVPVKGQMLRFALFPEQFPSMLLYRGRYLIPRRDGQVLFGSTVETVDFDKTPTAAAQADLLQALRALVPIFHDYQPAQQWAGLRPGAPAGIPYVDSLASGKVVINAGHFRNGIILGLASATLAVALLTGTALPFSPLPYRLEAKRP